MHSLTLILAILSISIAIDAAAIPQATAPCATHKQKRGRLINLVSRSPLPPDDYVLPILARSPHKKENNGNNQDSTTTTVAVTASTTAIAPVVDVNSAGTAAATSVAGEAAVATGTSTTVGAAAATVTQTVTLEMFSPQPRELLEPPPPQQQQQQQQQQLPLTRKVPVKETIKRILFCFLAESERSGKCSESVNI
ncbi:hypothetical protein RUND412_010323 [Rhizina undulata]